MHGHFKEIKEHQRVFRGFLLYASVYHLKHKARGRNIEYTCIPVSLIPRIRISRYKTEDVEICTLKDEENKAVIKTIFNQNIYDIFLNITNLHSEFLCAPFNYTIQICNLLQINTFWK